MMRNGKPFWKLAGKSSRSLSLVRRNVLQPFLEQPEANDAPVWIRLAAPLEVANEDVGVQDDRDAELSRAHGFFRRLRY
jgi:hypothetical protein